MHKGFYLNPYRDKPNPLLKSKQSLQTYQSHTNVDLSIGEHGVKFSNRNSHELNPYGLSNSHNPSSGVMSPTIVLSKNNTPISLTQINHKYYHSRATKSLSKNPLEEFMIKPELSPKMKLSTHPRETISREKFEVPPRTSFTRGDERYNPRSPNFTTPDVKMRNKRVIVSRKKSRSPSNEFAQSIIFTDNVKKYRIANIPGPTFKNSKSVLNLASPRAVVRDIKNLINLHLKSPPKKRTIIKLQAMNDLNISVANKTDMSKEDELKIYIVKRKIQISNTFDRLVELDQKKNKYKEYLMEYHPDKGRYEKAVCDDITNFLVLTEKAY